MWQVNGRTLNAERFGTFEPVRILNDYDGPKLFTFWDADGALCLACWSDESPERIRFLVVPVTDADIIELTTGVVTVREALQKPRLWILDIDNDWSLLGAWLVDPVSVPKDAQPQPGVMLHRSLEPLLSLRAIGDRIRSGEIPGSVIKGIVEGAQKALKCLAEYETDRGDRRGRPSRALQQLYDLPAQRLRAASFEVQFRSPINDPDLFAGLQSAEVSEELDVLTRIGDHLRRGLVWLTATRADTPATPAPDDPELNRVIVKALKFLTPSPHGLVREVEVRGVLAAAGMNPIRLTHASRRLVNGAAARLAVTRTQVQITGRVRELDIDRMSFQLREHDDRGRECRFEQNHLDDVYELLGSEQRVLVSGWQTLPSGVIEVREIFIPDA